MAFQVHQASEREALSETLVAPQGHDPEDIHYLRTALLSEVEYLRVCEQVKKRNWSQDIR
jgi:hypothetical protein